MSRLLTPRAAAALLLASVSACSDGTQNDRDVTTDRGSVDTSVGDTANLDSGGADSGAADTGATGDGSGEGGAADSGSADVGCRRDQDCDDGNQCTMNVCDVATGTCGFRSIPSCCNAATDCDDGNRCTTDTCDAAAHRCVRAPVAGCCAADTDCDDHDVCTRDACDTANNRCTTSPIASCCTSGATQACYTGPAGTSGRGRCRAGVQTCTDNRFDGAPCVGEVLPAASEECDAAGVDENCNGMVNEDCSCTGTMSRACYTGPAGTQGVARCAAGTQSCASGRWGACGGQTLPATEICGNGIDEDCNGSDLLCPPLNDSRANAIPLTLTVREVVQLGTTVGATNDGPSSSCLCTHGPNVWYRFTLPTDSSVYLDTSATTTAESGTDTSLFLTDNAGVLLPAQPGNGQPQAGLCNDDSGCTGLPGWGSSLQSRTWGFLAAGTYYVAVGSCGSGPFVLRLQHIPITEGSYFYNDRISGASTDTTFLIGTNQHSSHCGGMISGEDVRWFITCGGVPQTFSLCEGDGGGYVSRLTSAETSRYDPVLYLHSGVTGIESVCSDTGAAGVDCRGRIGSSLASTVFDTVQGGPRLVSTTAATRGLNAVLVDERVRGTGMDYRLSWTVRDR